MSRVAPRRCAIYTRKSSEQGLEQDFNSLDAQREAASAYIASQKHDGWKLVETHYDDGGWSGGNMDRPALQALLVDIEQGKIDIVVVYKVDRLTRSLADFAKLIEILDRNQVSFVSVTQQFNTTTSMGRLTLNVLLSFAQFEREVTGERIRDKVLASKKKGIFMGGNPPLGYDIGNRRLNVNQVEAEQVRTIFALYLELGCVRRLKSALERKGIRSKAWVSQKGRSLGGGAFSKGALYYLLRNRVYLGEVAHKGQMYPGEHEAILTSEVYDAAQTLLDSNRVARRSAKNVASFSLLRGLIVDAAGRAMTPSYTSKRGQQYRYYVAISTDDDGPILRLPATEIEALVLRELDSLLRDRNAWVRHLNLNQTDAEAVDQVMSAAVGLAKALKAGGAEAAAAIRELVDRVAVSAWSATIAVRKRTIAARCPLLVSTAAVDQEDLVTLTTDLRLSRRGAGKRILLPSGTAAQELASPNTALIRSIAQAYAWRLDLEVVGVTIQDVANKAGVSRSLVSQQLALAYLAPDVIDAVLQGRQPRSLQLHRLVERLPLDWQVQRQALDFV